jgi:F-type H+-transporting ATPase subunit b
MTPTLMLAAMQLLPEPDSPLERVVTTFGLDWPQLLAQMVSFGLVCVLLQRLAYAPVLQMLESRRQVIANSREQAEHIRAERARLDDDRARVLSEAHAEGQRLIEEARHAAARVLFDETQKAIALGEQLLRRAQERGERDRARMRGDLKREMGRLVISATAAVTGKVLTPDDHQRLIEETARQLAS